MDGQVRRESRGEGAIDGTESPEALIARFGPQVLQTIRRRLPRRLRNLFDSQDFAQAAWASFFRNADQVPRQSPSEVRGRVRRIAINKVVDEIRAQFGTQKRQAGKQVPLQWNESEIDHVPARDPRPSEVAVANECIPTLTAGFPGEFQRLADLRVHGAAPGEIAKELGVSERTVFRMLRQLEQAQR